MLFKCIVFIISAKKYHDILWTIILYLLLIFNFYEKTPYDKITEFTAVLSYLYKLTKLNNSKYKY